MRKTLIALLAASVLVAGCGGSKSGSSSTGAKVFASAGCGGCHTLSAAKSNGQTGPDLDQLKPSYAAVVHQVSSGGGGMPSFSGKLSDGQINDVARFVTDSTKNNSAALTAFKPNGQKLSDCHGDYACYKQAFGNLAYYDGPATALARVATYMQTATRRRRWRTGR
jgi:cytochrome c553